MKLIGYIRIFIVLMFLVAAAGGQDDETVRSETDLVTVNVAVRDGQGKFVEGLRAEQFEIFDNRTKQEIAYFSAAEAPVSYGIVYDMHPTTEARTTAVLDSLRAFTKEFGADDRFFVVAFNERGYLNTDFVPTLEQLQKNMKPAEPRSLYDAIYLAADKLRGSKNLKRTLLVISDSADHGSRHNFSDLSKQLKSFDVQVYAVIFDDSEMWSYADMTRGERRRRVSDEVNPLDRAALEDLTMKSGGAANFPNSENERELYQIYRRIDREMRRFYSLSFYPAQTDGKWHDLRIGLRSVTGSKKFALTYRQGYQSGRRNR